MLLTSFSCVGASGALQLGGTMVRTTHPCIPSAVSLLDASEDVPWIGGAPRPPLSSPAARSVAVGYGQWCGGRSCRCCQRNAHVGHVHVGRVELRSGVRGLEVTAHHGPGLLAPAAIAICSFDTSHDAHRQHAPGRVAGRLLHSFQQLLPSDGSIDGNGVTLLPRIGVMDKACSKDVQLLYCSMCSAGVSQLCYVCMLSHGDRSKSSCNSNKMTNYMSLRKVHLFQLFVDSA